MHHASPGRKLRCWKGQILKVKQPRKKQAKWEKEQGDGETTSPPKEWRMKGATERLLAEKGLSKLHD